ncbi:MAG: DUF1549 and DUF1553 domain-containing protein [Paludisphaera borealis]|uniref:DUF1549 and DUF1553 domain-containing protein n=1 Tax=Paludisphaera borealis TaxID=1387353 RepID=UPI00284E7F09|nr:DUF1549 and DUF1553 domain-containing protein [Paludisphaera borealis]MDR3621098.1 DUF1549 and DUF1553 domain-containing protein [Paludisphaera borealis]
MPRRWVGPMIAACLTVAHAGCGRATPPAVTPPRSDASPPRADGPTSTPHPPPIVQTEARPIFKVEPSSFTIAAEDPGVQLLAIGTDAGEAGRDLKSRVIWRVEPSGIATIDSSGYVLPLAAGAAAIVASDGGGEVRAQVVVAPRDGRSWDFATDVAPLLSKHGCNTGACHGKADGQNGFHLSLFGYDTEADLAAMARDGGQRRISPFDPRESLLLTKSTGRTPHAGGPRIALDSPDYQTLFQWIKAGAPARTGKKSGGLARITIEPSGAPLAGPGVQQLRVLAEFADGRRRDVTRQAVYKSLDESSVTVDPRGKAELLRRTEADVTVRYGPQVASVRLSTPVNPGLVFDFRALPRANLIDDELFKRLESLKVPPSPPATDAAFLRRASLDLTGAQPSPVEVRRYIGDKDPDKRIKLVDSLLARPEFIAFWRIKFGDLLQISVARQGNGAYRYQEWVDDCLAKNTPWDEMVRTMLTAVGDPTAIGTGGPVNYAMDALEPIIAAEQSAQRFLGLRMRCAQCHDHPFDVWTQDDYFGFAAFFAKVQRGGMGMPGAMMGKPTIVINPKGQVVHLRTQKPAAARLLDGKPVTIAEKDDPRAELARWMTAADNPYFAKAAVNWVWAQFFGKGLVDPADDMSRANPAVHPELLDALAKRFATKKFDLRDLIRTVATSQTYGLSSATVAGNERDTRLFSHQTPRPLTAHQMADALAQATDVPNRFPGADPFRRAIRVADPSVQSMILDTFGRCPRTSACASVQTPPLSLKQSLLLIGGDVVESKVASLNGYLAGVLKLELEPEELVENLYFRTVCRPPTAEESSRWTAELKQATSLQEAAEDLFWALLNSREFAFNH